MVTTSTSTFTASEIAALLQCATRRRFAPKSVILSEGEVADSLYLVLTGSVTVSVEDVEGEELILTYLGPGECFGELGLFEATPRRSASVYARTACEVAVVTYERLRRLIDVEPKLLLPIMRQIAQRLRGASQKLGDLVFLDVAGRIARTLLDLAADSQAITHPDGMLVRITREELGRLVNCSRKMAGRVLADLQQQGLIEMHGKCIVVYGTVLNHPSAKPLLTQ